MCLSVTNKAYYVQTQSIVPTGRLSRNQKKKKKKKKN